VGVIVDFVSLCLLRLYVQVLAHQPAGVPAEHMFVLQQRYDVVTALLSAFKVHVVDTWAASCGFEPSSSLLGASLSTPLLSAKESSVGAPIQDQLRVSVFKRHQFGVASVAPTEISHTTQELADMFRAVDADGMIALVLFGALKLLVVRVLKLLSLPAVTTAYAKRTDAAASVERRRREPDRAISPE
jgi:hypothetical protein